jgi:hypothetical protein
MHERIRRNRLDAALQKEWLRPSGFAANGAVRDLLGVQDRYDPY